jgi:hypothetical protein
LLAQLETTLRGWTSDFDKQTFTLDEKENVYKFFSPSKGTMAAYRVKSVSFDLILSVAVCGYLLLLAVLVQGPRAAFASFMKMINSQSDGSRQKFKRK